MGPMLRGEKLNKRKVTKLSILGLAAMFTWSLIAAPAAVTQEAPAPEPEEVIAYSTFAEAAPVSNYLDHKSPVPAPAFGIALAHSQTEVNQPSQASGLAWLADFGIANGLHGTTTGAAVPTEATARQPGGTSAAEYKAAGGPVGEDEFGRVAAGWSRATATQVGSPRGFAHSFIANAILFPAAGSPPEAPGTYDPGATFPGGPGLAPTPDPGPRNQMGILAIGSIASTSESVRTGDVVTSIGVAELQGINIGNRTSDGRCTNCFVLDAIRVETFASTNGKGSQASYRVMLGRACRRTLVTTQPPYAALTGPEEGLPKEEDQCLAPGAPAPYTFDGSDERIAQFNEFFSTPLVIPGATCPGSNAPCTIAIRMTAGQIGHADPKRPERTVNPPDGACRNYAYPDPTAKGPVEDCQALPEHIRPNTGPDKDSGQVAQAVAEGIDIEILTLTGTQLVPTNEQLDACFGAFDTVPLPGLPEGVPSEVGLVTGVLSGCPVAGLRQVRELNVTLGVSQAAAIARPNIVVPPTDTGGGLGGGVGGVVPPIDGGGLGGVIPPIDSGGGQTVVGGGGLGAGAYRLKIDWSSFKIKPLPAGDMAKAVLAGGIFGGMALLIRRRLRFAQG